MDPGNDFYGHRRLLSDYVFGESRNLVIWGYVQHGWNLIKGISPEQPVRLNMRQYLWSAENLRLAREAGERNVVPIGAPFLYLASQRTPVTPKPGSTLVYPFHAWEGDRTAGSHQGLIAELASELGTDVTVCLYWLEFENPEIRQAYEAAGFRVISHGHRDGDPDFLHRQIAELERHETVVANRVATALWYGGYLGRAIRVVGEGFGVGSREEGIAFERLARQRWPELFADGLVGEAAIKVAGRELGSEFIMDREQLADSLGWSGWRRRAGPALGLALDSYRSARSKFN